MWKPPQRLDYTPSLGRMPSRAQVARTRLFSPIDVGPIRLRERSWVPAMVPWRATADGMMTDEVLAWYARLARGRPGAIVVEATGIRDIPSGPLLRIGHDRFLPGLGRLAETVRRESGGETRLFIQIIDFLAIRRRPQPAKFFGHFLEITERHRALLGAEELDEPELRARLAALPAAELARVLSPRELEALRFGARERVSDVHLSHIRELPERLPGLFADAAWRAKEAGFDGVELHYAHAYTMASFLSATNTRDDGYGGSREGRVRLPLEVFAAVKARVGDGFAVGCRFLAEEGILGGSTLADAVHFGVAFARAGMDFLSTSRGGKFDDAKEPAIGEAAYPYTGASGYECMPHHLSDAAGPFGRNAAATAAIRRAVRAAGLKTPVVLTGGIHNFKMAERLLAEGACDIVGAARQSLADPDWWRKVRLGLGDTVRLCAYTNYCEGLDQKHKTVTCKLWDRQGLAEPGVRLTADGKRRLTAPEWEPPEVD
ncbi:MAG TPA: NADH:flavin oxidoreductase [Alphaproteobacteria bacterium]|nr:NADH:flavin oxidoreductase [Alphaproteobacteria bacterium]